MSFKLLGNNSLIFTSIGKPNTLSLGVVEVLHTQVEDFEVLHTPLEKACLSSGCDDVVGGVGSEGGNSGIDVGNSPPSIEYLSGRS